MNWISVKDKLPDNFADCLAYGIPTCGTCGDSPLVKQSTFSDTRGFEFGAYDCGIEATHWMPLPEAPCDE
jgi:hypothetical protein